MNTLQTDGMVGGFPAERGRLIDLPIAETNETNEKGNEKAQVSVPNGAANSDLDQSAGKKD